MGVHRKQAVFIVGGGFVNKGAEAMVLTVANALRKHLPDMHLYVRVRSHDLRQARDNGLTPVKSDQSRWVIPSLPDKIRTARMYYKCKVMIHVGGYQLGDPWGVELARSNARATKRCVRFGNLVFYMPQAWGPFSSPAIANAARYIIETATLSYVRDKTSLAEIEKLVGKGHPKVRFAPDIAWTFEGADLSVGRRLIRDAGLPEKDSSLTVCITPNLRVYKKFDGSGPSNEYIKYLCQLIEHLCAAHNGRVILIGHELRPDNSKVKDDRTLCNYVLSALDKSLPVAHIDKVIAAAEIKSLIANCDLLISSRYHAIIAALSQGIPAAAIGWSHKYDELLAEVGLSSNLISIPKTDNETFEYIDLIVGRLAEIHDIITPRVEAMKTGARQVLDEVISKIRESL